MSNTNKNLPCFQSITGVQDISHESADAYSGGQIILYDQPGFVTTILSTSVSVGNLGGANDRASSVRVTSGNWRLHTGANYTGSTLTLMGAQGISQLNSIFNNQVSSVFRIS